MNPRRKATHKLGPKLGASLVLGLAAPLVLGCPATPKTEQQIDIDVRRYVVNVDPDELAIGGEQPLVTIVLWSDYACAPCGRTWTVMQHLVEDYGDDIRVIYRAGTVPGFQHGERAAEAAFAAAGQDKFWDMHWRLFEHPDDFSRPVLRKHAEAIGLDVQQFLDDLDTGKYAAPRIRHRRQAAELGISPLPAAFCNGLFVLGYKDEAGWHALIDREIASARKMLQDGVKRSDIYAEFMRTAKRGRVDENDEAKRLREERVAEAAAAEPAKLASPDFKSRYAVPTGAPGWGPADAPVVLVEFVDYQCPYCRKAHEQIVPQLREQFGDQLRIEIRQLPLEIHPSAAAAARAALTAAQQGKFGEFHERLFASGSGALGFSTFVRIAEEIGMDVEGFKRDFQTRAVGDKLAEDVLLARRLGIQGTPGFFVNGRYVDGARNVATYAEMIEAELARAKQLEAQGTPRAGLYAALMQGALGPEQFPNAKYAVASVQLGPSDAAASTGAGEPNPKPNPTPAPAESGQP
jgi:protein-disulfide isomerase